MGLEPQAGGGSRSRALVACHVGRSRLYRLTLELMRTLPSSDSLARLRGLRPDGAQRSMQELLRALQDTDPSDIREEFACLFAPTAARRRCLEPRSRERALACAAADVPLTTNRASELEALSILAERTAWAVAAFEPRLAATAFDLQMRLLGEHAQNCLGQLAGELEASGASFYRRVGTALRLQLEDDAELLHPGLL